MKQIFEKLNDVTSRVEKMIFLAGAMAATDVFSDDLNEFFEEEEKTIEECLGEIPDWVDLDERGYARSENIFEWLTNARKFGFLVQFATPVMKPTGESSRTFSWGYYSTKWIYADTIDEAIDKGLGWVAKRRADEDAKVGKSAGGAS